MEKATLRISSSTEKLSDVREFVSGAAYQFGFDDEAVGKISLAVDEACTNIIKHAYEYAPNKEIEITINTNRTQFEVVITHQGKLLDPKSIKSPDMKDYLAHPRRGGLGIHLMRLLMDSVEYKIRDDKKCEVHLLKKLSAAAG